MIAIEEKDGAANALGVIVFETLKAEIEKFTAYYNNRRIKQKLG